MWVMARASQTCVGKIPLHTHIEHTFDGTLVP